MNQSVLKNLCRSPYDPKILSEVYAIYNYFNFEAGIEYSLEQLYVALTVPGIQLIHIIFIDFLDLCYRDGNIKLKFAKNPAIRRLQFLLSWQHIYKTIFEYFEIEIDSNIQVLLVNNKLDPIELRQLFYYFVRKIKFPTTLGKSKIILYQLQHHLVKDNKDHQGTIKELAEYKKLVKNKKNIQSSFNQAKQSYFDDVIDELGETTSDEIQTILEFGCSQIKRFFEDDDDKITIFKNRTMLNILFYRQDTRLYELQGKEIKELENKMKLSFDMQLTQRENNLEQQKRYLLKLDPYDHTKWNLEEFYIIQGDIKVLECDELIQNFRRIWFQLSFELHDYATSINFKSHQIIYDKFQEEIRRINDTCSTKMMIKSFIQLVKSYKGKDKKEQLIPNKELRLSDGDYTYLKVEQGDYFWILTVYDRILRSIHKGRVQNKLTLSDEEILHSKNTQMALLAQMEKEIKQRRKLQQEEYDITEQQKQDSDKLE